MVEDRPPAYLCTTRLGFPAIASEGALPQNVECVVACHKKLDRRTIPQRSPALSSAVPPKEPAPRNRDDCSVGRFRLSMCWAARILVGLSAARGTTSTSPPNLIDESLELQCPVGANPSWVFPATNGPPRWISATASLG